MKIDINIDNIETAKFYDYEGYDFGDINHPYYRDRTKLIDELLDNPNNFHLIFRPDITPELIEALFGEEAKVYFIAKRNLKEKR